MHAPPRGDPAAVVNARPPNTETTDVLGSQAEEAAASLGSYGPAHAAPVASSGSSRSVNPSGVGPGMAPGSRS